MNGAQLPSCAGPNRSHHNVGEVSRRRLQTQRDTSERDVAGADRQQMS